jgi:ribosomal protein L35|tara:strand:- start:12661 stop:12855 length:195 start_codon:yes stop_codon:yes gene_type:complete
MKTNKSYTKRLKVTKKGKVLARKPGQNHFNAKETRSTRMKRKRVALFPMTQKNKSRFLGKQRTA